MWKTRTTLCQTCSSVFEPAGLQQVTINTVIEIVKEAATGAAQNRDLCLICLDDRNAFNTAPWRLIDKALQRKNTLNYLRKVIRSYLQDRRIIVKHGELRSSARIHYRANPMEPVLRRSVGNSPPSRR